MISKAADVSQYLGPLVLALALHLVHIVFKGERLVRSQHSVHVLTGLVLQ